MSPKVIRQTGRDGVRWDKEWMDMLILTLKGSDDIV